MPAPLHVLAHGVAEAAAAVLLLALEHERNVGAQPALAPVAGGRLLQLLHRVDERQDWPLCPQSRREQLGCASVLQLLRKLDCSNMKYALVPTRANIGKSHCVDPPLSCRPGSHASSNDTCRLKYEKRVLEVGTGTASSDHLVVGGAPPVQVAVDGGHVEGVCLPVPLHRRLRVHPDNTSSATGMHTCLFDDAHKTVLRIPLVRSRA